MGRGTEADGDEWRDIGVTPILNAPDDAKAEYLRGLDIFVSPSMWEGFNLPVVEAQALGTVGIGFDAGAHPETALHLASSLNDAITMIEHWNTHREHLAIACERAYKYVRTEFSWTATAEGIVQHCEEVLLGAPPKSRQMSTTDDLEVNSDSQEPKIGTFNRAIRLPKREGVGGMKRVIKSRVLKKNPK
jgi:hypothetical protein